ncbi:MAG: F0F1 ATP synthase subunit epsilon [Chlorobi bacterium]|nr:F0F1 ATP synthase subunit epsilon [Chlorobiota bacterium]
MKNDDLYLEIVTPEKIIYNGPVRLVQVPGENGLFTLLKNHAPIIASLTKGEIHVIGLNGVEDLFKCDGGILECQENQATIIISG